MKDKLKLSISGAAEISTIDINHGKSKTTSFKNAVNAAVAIEALARNLAQQPGYGLYQIRVYNGASLLASKAVSSVTVTGAGDNIVRAVATFGATDFDGSYTKITLAVDGSLGEFSEITGLTLSKTNSELIQITWDLTITI